MTKVVMGEVGDPIKNYFEFLNTTVNTRNKNILLRLPKLKLEYGRRSAKYPRNVFLILPCTFIISSIVLGRDVPLFLFT